MHSTTAQIICIFGGFWLGFILAAMIRTGAMADLRDENAQLKRRIALLRNAKRTVA